MKTFKRFTFEELDRVHLSVLREIGRRIGVKAPAGKKKENLISDIIGIQNGEIIPEEPSKRGAPPKLEVDVSAYMVDYEEFLYPDNSEADKTQLKDPANSDNCTVMEGVLEIMTQGYGFLRAKENENSREDVFVATQNIKKYNLKKGDRVKATAKMVKDGESSAALQEVLEINGLSPEKYIGITAFENLVPCYPDKKIKLEIVDNADVSLRCIDLFSPVGFGQRGLIVAPPKTGKTTLLKKIAQAIENNYPNVKLYVLLIDERPEEVTDFKRSVNAEVVYSTFDKSADHHVKVAESVIAKAKRLVEVGEDVVILLDSITRLSRAYNVCVEHSGKTLSGGIDPTALYGPKAFLGSARNIENGGSLTILATALVDTGSRMDDVIYEEFKGTGNMELMLSRDLAERRIFPAIDLLKSGTRKEELLLNDSELDTAYKLRKTLKDADNATEMLIDTINKTKDNADLSKKLDAWIKVYKN